LSGRRFGDWLVLKRGHKHHKKTFWLCRCSCGVERDVRADHLMEGRSTACDSLVHCITTPERQRTFRSWAAMMERCFNPTNERYIHYGGRGITVCEQWRSFEGFHADMGDRPEGLTLGRKDNDLGYSPTNCRWETRREQSINRQNTKRVRWRGKTWLLLELCETLGVRYGPVAARLNKGWQLDEALRRPVRPKRPKAASTAIDLAC
jgi:hypothetical protein